MGTNLFLISHDVTMRIGKGLSNVSFTWCHNGGRKGIIQCQFHMSQRAVERGLSNVSFTCLKGQ